MTSQTIAVVGSLNMDLVIRTPRMPVPGETISGHDFHIIPGGKGANQAVAAARLGGQVSMIGRVGDDDFGRRQQECLQQDQIDLAFLTVDPQCATGIAMITLDERGQNSIIISPEANGAVSVEQIDAARAAITGAAMLICQLEVPLAAVTRAIELAAHANVPVLLNPAPAAQLPYTLLKQVHYLVLNESEAGLLTGQDVTDKDSAQRAATQLQKIGIPTVLLTLGEQGVIIVHQDTCTHESALSVEVVDTTAAGDTFVGAFAVAITEGQAVSAAVRFATRAAALTVTKLGAQSSIPTRPAVEQFQS